MIDRRIKLEFVSIKFVSHLEKGHILFFALMPYQGWLLLELK